MVDPRRIISMASAFYESGVLFAASDLGLFAKLSEVGEADAVNFFGMLHQESPDSIRALLGKAHASLNPGGIVTVMDMMTDRTHTSPRFSALFAVNMALTTESGWVFSDAELGEWMREAGFVDFAVKPLPAPMPHWLATGRKR
jgi:hypothetical protein